MVGRFRSWRELVGVALTLAALALTPASASAATGWSAPLQIGAGTFVPQVSCSSASFCVAVDGSTAWVWNGSSWGASHTIDPGNLLTSVSCPGPAAGSFCAAGDAQGNVVFYRNGSWGPPASIAASGALVSCASSSFCAAVIPDFSGFGGVGYATTFDGTSWTAPTLTDPLGFPVAVSCPLSSLCREVDSSGGGGGYNVRYNGQSWGLPETFYTSPVGISCTARRFCVEVSNTFFPLPTESYYTVNSGKRWGSPHSFGLNGSARAVSCASASFCMAIGPDNSSTFNGFSFAKPAAIGGIPLSMSSVSCPSSSFCLATGSSGGADYSVTHSSTG